jgi:hypothetical protein
MYTSAITHAKKMHVYFALIPNAVQLQYPWGTPLANSIRLFVQYCPPAIHKKIVLTSSQVSYNLCVWQLAITILH